MPRVELSEKGVGGLPIYPNLAMSKEPLSLDIDEFIDVNAGMIRSNIREDLEISSTTCVCTIFNLNQGRR